MTKKQKWNRFWTLRKQCNAGFTLVELIVVIAILAILAGAGTAGYAGYVKYANKNADKMLVGNIIRAIEIGTNSTMFVNDDSFKMGDISYPVGFVTLSTGDNGVQIITSHTERITGTTEGDCNMQTITYTYVTELGKAGTTCPNGGSSCSKKVYGLATKSVVCCVNHSKFVDTSSDIDTGKAKTYVHEGTLDSCDRCDHEYKVSENVIVPAGTAYYVEKESDIFVESPTAGMCKMAYANQHDIFLDENVVGEADTGDPILESLKAAFGDDLSDLKLQYKDWVADEGIDYATFYTFAPGMMDDMETLSNLLVSGQALAELLGKDLGLSAEYDSGEEVLAGVSDNVVNTFSEEQWMVQWNAAAGATWDSFGFGLTGRENYCAARMAYNNAFASYVASVDKSFAPGGENESYVANLKEFYSQSIAGVGLPGLICTDAFTDSASPLKDSINNEAVFKKLADHFEVYKGTTACKENGKVVYDVMSTVDATADIAMDDNNITGGDMYEYYGRYVDEVAALYSKAQESAGDGIVIVVTVENGKVDCLVSPAAADLRS